MALSEVNENRIMSMAEGGPTKSNKETKKDPIKETESIVIQFVETVYSSSVTLIEVMSFQALYLEVSRTVSDISLSFAYLHIFF